MILIEKLLKRYSPQISGEYFFIDKMAEYTYFKNKRFL